MIEGDLGRVRANSGNADDDSGTRPIAVPVMGRIAAGTPIEAIQTRSHVINMPPDLLSAGEHFALEVRGDSMIEAGIFEGDVVLIRKSEAADTGDIVVALIDDEEATLKRFRRRGACFGFLWWNAPTAKLFMGDVGSMAIGGVIAHVGTAGLGACIGGNHGRLGDFDLVVQFQRLDTGGIEDHGLVLDLRGGHLGRDFVNPGYPIGQQILETEHAGVLLHGALHFKPGFMHAGAVLLVVEAVEARQGLVDAFLRQGLVRLDIAFQIADSGFTGRLAEHQQVEQ